MDHWATSYFQLASPCQRHALPVVAFPVPVGFVRPLGVDSTPSDISHFCDHHLPVVNFRRFLASLIASDPLGPKRSDPFLKSLPACLCLSRACGSRFESLWTRKSTEAKLASSDRCLWVSFDRLGPSWPQAIFLTFAITACKLSEIACGPLGHKLFSTVIPLCLM